jgi:3-deoxy-D-manno-octulosonate 8-phosphate phosphatase (KDO 8-P phosphatase)
MIDPVFARSIKLVGFDVDGVMTDGGIYLGDVDGRRLEFKRYAIQDGIGVALLRRAALRVAIVTGRISESVTLRAHELGVEDVVQGPDGHKLGGFLSILERHGIQPEECAFVGDDFPDLPLLRAVGLPVCVANAVPEVRRECRVHLTSHGGRGAVREFSELLLKARGAWDSAWQGYVAERSSSAMPSAAVK